MLLKDLDHVQIHEEETDKHVRIIAKNSLHSETLVTYANNPFNKDFKDIFRNIAMSYYKELKSKFESN